MTVCAVDAVADPAGADGCEAAGSFAGKLPLACVLRVPGLLLAGYAAVNGTSAVPGGPGLVAIALDTYLGVTLSGRRRGWHLRCVWRLVLARRAGSGPRARRPV
jgi:hypothetical protein